MDTIKCNGAIEMILRQGNLEIAKHFDSEVIFLKAAMRPPNDDAVKDEIEELKRVKKPKSKLTVLVETPGGYIETVERIVSIFRNHFSVVEYVVPNYAYSAGTVLVLSGDNLYMNYYSILGPIDPQISAEDSGGMLPGMGYLAKFQELLGTINDPAKSPEQVRGEITGIRVRCTPDEV